MFDWEGSRDVEQAEQASRGLEILKRGGRLTSARKAVLGFSDDADENDSSAVGRKSASGDKSGSFTPDLWAIPLGIPDALMGIGYYIRWIHLRLSPDEALNTNSEGIPHNPLRVVDITLRSMECNIRVPSGTRECVISEAKSEVRNGVAF